MLRSADAFRKYQQATGAIMDHTTGMLMITPQQYDKLQDLTFKIGGKPFALTPNAQIWPRSRNNLLGGKSDATYLIVSEMSEAKVNRLGFHFLIGYTFLQVYIHCLEIRQS